MKRILVFVCSLLAASSATAQSAEDLFQQALRVERVSSNPEAAILLYQQIVELPGADRELVAKAWLQIGKAYEVLGEEGAVGAYSRVVNDYADLREIAGEASQRMAGLAQPRTDPKPSAPPSTIGFELPPNVDPWGGHLSHDGTLLLSTERSSIEYGGALLLVNLVSESVTTLVPGRPSGFAQSPRFSPDDEQVAYGWWDGEGYAYIQVIDLSTRAVRTVLDFQNRHRGTGLDLDWREGNSAPFDPYVLDWTEDGSALLVYNDYATGRESAAELLMVPVDGSGARMVGELGDVVDWTYDSGCLAADDRYALLGYIVEDFPQRFIQRIDLVTGAAERWRASETTSFELIDCRGVSGEVIYLADQLSNRFLFTADGATPSSEGTDAILKPVSADFRVLARSNSDALAVYSDVSASSKLLVVALDGAGEIDGVVETLHSTGQGNVARPGRWSPDGSRFSWFTNRPLTAHVWAVESKSRSSFPLTLDRFPRAVLWSVDGSSLVMLRGAQEGMTVSELDLDSGEEAVLGISETQVYDLGPDGKSVIAQSQSDPLCLDELDLTSRIRTPLHCTSEAEVSRLGTRASQDYKHYLTYTIGEQSDGAVLRIMDASTGSVHLAFQSKGNTPDARMGWLRFAEPSMITFAESDRSGAFDKLFRLDVQSGRLDPIWTESLALMELSSYQILAGGGMAVIQGRQKTEGRVGRVMRY